MGLNVHNPTIHCGVDDRPEHQPRSGLHNKNTEKCLNYDFYDMDKQSCKFKNPINPDTDD